MNIVELALQEDYGFHFTVHGQPIVPVDHYHEAIGWYELLLRLHDPTRELLSPADFMPGDDFPHLLKSIDWWVLHEAAALMRRFPDLHFSVNFSRYLLADPLLLPQLRSTFEGLDSDRRLTLEISEKWLNWTQDEIEVLEAIGSTVLLHIDDLGEAKLNELVKLPINGFKIDGSLILGILKDVKARALVSSLIRLAAELDLVCVCEFVENEDIWNHLRWLAYHNYSVKLFVQGHAIERGYYRQEW